MLIVFNILVTILALISLRIHIVFQKSGKLHKQFLGNHGPHRLCTDPQYILYRLLVLPSFPFSPFPLRSLHITQEVMLVTQYISLY